ncbi:MAG: M15 family metallopeptidase [Rikenellaceae bacterium]|nr:M15 family metallopeptidase [Rikenellaceae bacterium]
MAKIITLCAFIFSLMLPFHTEAQQPDFNALMEQQGLVDVQQLDSEIKVELKYATEDNFVGENMYGSLTTAYLLPHFAQKVVRAQKILRERYPDYSLLIYDAARPISVQRRMRRAVEGTPLEIYVADGTRGGRHNYGVAVDLTIVDKTGTPLDMGAKFDHFGQEAWVGNDADVTLAAYKAYVKKQQERCLISAKAASNRILLLEIMDAVGLRPYVKEWWHYQERISMSATRERYKLLDF